VVTGSKVSNGAGGNTLCKGAYGASFAAGAEDGPSGVPLFHEGMALGPNLTQAQLTGLRVAFTEVLFGGVSPAAGAVPVVGPLLAPLKLLMHGLSAVSSDPCQFPKPVLVPSGELGWSPEVLPFQLLRTGPVVIAGIPGEMTVQAGRRLKKRILDALAPRGVTRVILTGLANEYSAYITTPEEYMSQQYEGASTLYGRLTLDAYLQIFGQLADAMAAGQPVPPGPTPRDLGANQIELQTGVLFDAVPPGQSFGMVITEPPLAVRPEEKLTVRFRGAHPKNDLRRNDSYLRIERNEGGANWSLVAWDAMPETRMLWQVDKTFLCVGCSLVDVSWTVPRDAQAGVYRIRHMGHWKNGTSGALTAYEGVTQTFTVGAVSMPRALNVAACGASGQRACCVSERLGFPCDQGLQEGSNCVGPACTCGGPNPGGSLKSMGMCVPVPAPVHVTACGGQGQRACCVAEQLPSCNPGLREVSSCGGGANCICGGLNPGSVLKSAGMCAPAPQAPAITACGAQGQRACCLSERFPSCDGGLRENAGCTAANCTCGGPNPGAAVKSNGMCVR
jgi:hypothetical protein